MTDKEYNDRVAKIAISDASIEVRTKALEALDKEYNESRSLLIAKSQYLESQGDLDDID